MADLRVLRRKHHSPRSRRWEHHLLPHDIPHLENRDYAGISITGYSERMAEGGKPSPLFRRWFGNSWPAGPDALFLNQAHGLWSEETDESICFTKQ